MSRETPPNLTDKGESAGHQGIKTTAKSCFGKFRQELGDADNPKAILATRRTSAAAKADMRALVDIIRLLEETKEKIQNTI